MTTKSMVSAENYNALKLGRDQLAAKLISISIAVLVYIKEVEFDSDGNKNLLTSGEEEMLERLSASLQETPAQSLLIHDAEVLEKMAIEFKAYRTEQAGTINAVAYLKREATSLRLQAKEKDHG